MQAAHQLDNMLCAAESHVVMPPQGNSWNLQGSLQHCPCVPLEAILHVRCTPHWHRQEKQICFWLNKLVMFVACTLNALGLRMLADAEQFAPTDIRGKLLI